jgi:hypothetical protein
VITKAWNEIVRAVGCRNDHLTFACINDFAVDGDADRIWINNWLWRCLAGVEGCHDYADTADGVETAVTGIEMRLTKRASNSLRNNVIAECNGANADGPTKQIVVIL